MGDFKKAIHADETKLWHNCARRLPFVDGTDKSPYSMQGDQPVFARVIDKSQRTVFFHGMDDYKLLARGTQLGIQVR